MKVFVLKSCDTCRKALRWLDEHGVAYTAQDIRADGLSRGDLEHIVRSVGWDNAINRRSTTWRQLDDTERAVDGPEDTIALIAKHPTLMKRPAFVTEQEVMVGFTDDVRSWLQG